MSKHHRRRLTDPLRRPGEEGNFARRATAQIEGQNDRRISGVASGEVGKLVLYR